MSPPKHQTSVCVLLCRYLYLRPEACRPRSEPLGVVGRELVAAAPQSVGSRRLGDLSSEFCLCFASVYRTVLKVRGVCHLLLYFLPAVILRRTLRGAAFRYIVRICIFLEVGEDWSVHFVVLFAFCRASLRLCGTGVRQAYSTSMK